MNTTDQGLVRLLFAATVVIVTNLVAGAARANINATWCAEYQVQYTDSSGLVGKEDVYWSTAVQTVPAQYMEASVFYSASGGWESVADGYMTQMVNSNYCFNQPLSLVRGGRYRFRLYTRMTSGERTVMIMKDSSTWNAPNRFYMDYDYIIPTTWQDGSSYTLPLQTFTTLHKNISAAGIVRQLIGMGDNVGYFEHTVETNPRDIKIYINQHLTTNPPAPDDDGDNCYTQFVNGEVTNAKSTSSLLWLAICIPPASGGNGATAINKFNFGHELGHAMARISGGPAVTSYEADLTGNTFIPSTELCKCPADAGGNRANHCLQSREYISASAGESFASFISTALFNYRSWSAWFNYYKVLDNSLGGSPPNWFDWTATNHEWMRSSCVPAAGDFGGLSTELDWAELYWQLWQGGTGRFDVDDITALWRGASYPEYCCWTPSQCGFPIYSGGQQYCVGIRGLPTPTIHKFGPFWEHRTSHVDGIEYLVTRAYNLLTADQFERFTQLGDDLGVNGNP